LRFDYILYILISRKCNSPTRPGPPDCSGLYITFTHSQ